MNLNMDEWETFNKIDLPSLLRCYLLLAVGLVDLGFVVFDDLLALQLLGSSHEAL